MKSVGNVPRERVVHAGQFCHRGDGIRRGHRRRGAGRWLGSHRRWGSLGTKKQRRSISLGRGATCGSRYDRRVLKLATGTRALGYAWWLPWTRRIPNAKGATKTTTRGRCLVSSGTRSRATNFKRSKENAKPTRWSCARRAGRVAPSGTSRTRRRTKLDPIEREPHHRSGSHGVSGACGALEEVRMGRGGMMMASKNLAHFRIFVRPADL